MTLEVVLLVLVTLLSPLLVAAALAVDTTLWLIRRKPFMAIRLLAMLWWFLAQEIRGVSVLTAIWLTSIGGDSHRRRERVYRLRGRWAGGHIDAIQKIFSMKLEIDGLEDAAGGPVVILIRHASIIDNMLPDAIVNRAHTIGLRYVLKRELEMIPTIDIGGRMVPTAFVNRASGNTDAELAKLRPLATQLTAEEGILIYPEGTRHTPEKLKRAQEKIAERQPEIAPLANRLQNLLPPRLGGPITLLDEARGADVVVLGHVGLDGFEYVSDIWAGGLVGTTIKLKFWRHAAAEVPAGHDELVAWLYDRWFALDDWVGEQLATGRG